MKYRIGVVAKLLGISPEGLRLYERDGILESRREENGSGYRYYERLDITALLRARAYQKYGFSLKETESLINTDDIDQIVDGYTRRSQQLAEEIARKRRMLDYLNKTSAIIERLPEELWQIRRDTRPGLYRFEFMKGDELMLKPEAYGDFQRWVSMAPFTFPSQRNEWEALTEGRDRSFSALGMMEEDAAALGVRESELVRYFPPCSCLYTVVRISRENASCDKYLAHLREFVEREGIQVTGDPVARTFLSMNKRDDYTRYRQIWLPVE